MLRLIRLALHGLRSLLRSRADLTLENLALRQQVAALEERQPRPRLSDADRLFWVLLHRIWARWADVLEIVQPDTVVRWHRAGFRAFWRWKSHRRRRPGRPPVDAEIRRLVRRMATENPSWGAQRIHSEFLKLGLAVSEHSVSRYLPRRPTPGDVVDRSKTFLRNHRHDMAAMDFFTVPTATFAVLHVLFVIHHGRRRILHCAVTRHPTASWVVQQLRNAFPWDTAPRYLIFDRDTKFGGSVREALRAFGVEPVRTAFRSPWQNGTAERWVGSVRRELLDHVVVLGEDHLRRLLLEYVAYYNEDRGHLSLDKDSPERRPVEGRPAEGPQVVGLPRVGGLHHRYEWREAA